MYRITFMSFSLCHLWGAGKVLSDCIILTWGLPYQGLQCLRPMGMARPSLGQAQGNYKAFFWSEDRSWQWTQKYQPQLPPVGSLQSEMAPQWRAPPRLNHLLIQLYIINPHPHSTECDTLWVSVLVVHLYQSAEPSWFQIFHGNVCYTFIR